MSNEGNAAIGQPNRRLFYGYRIVGASFVFMLVFGGVGFYAFGLFVVPLQDDFGWSRAGIMLANTVSTALRGLSAVLVGRLVDRYHPKWVVFSGAAFAGVALMVAARATELWQFVVFFGLGGIGFSAISFIPVTAILFRWFDKHRGRAIGISAAGTGIGGLVVAPVIGGYLIPSVGWSTAMFVMGAFTILSVVPLALIVIRRNPEQMGLYPDGLPRLVAKSGSEDGPDNASGLTLAQAVHTPSFWLAVMSCATFGFPMIALLQNQAAHLQDIGFPSLFAAGALGAVGLMNAAGKPAFGFLTESMKAKYALSVGLALQLMAVVIIINLTPSSPGALLWVYAVCLGLGIGSWAPTMSMLVSTNFGMAAYGTIFGTISLINTLGNSLGPLFAGRIFDVTGSYRPAFFTFIGFYAVAIVSTLLIRKPRIRSNGEVTSGGSPAAASLR